MHAASASRNGPDQRRVCWGGRAENGVDNVDTDAGGGSHVNGHRNGLRLGQQQQQQQQHAALQALPSQGPAWEGESSFQAMHMLGTGHFHGLRSMAPGHNNNNNNHHHLEDPVGGRTLPPPRGPGFTRQDTALQPTPRGCKAKREKSPERAPKGGGVMEAMKLDEHMDAASLQPLMPLEYPAWSTLKWEDLRVNIINDGTLLQQVDAINSGTFCSVLRATYDGRTVALKRPHAPHVEKDYYMTAYRSCMEWRILARADHPNVLGLIGE
eukprot:GHVU01140111.1.p1 GENE.GHVU01140111.1~~GHVU01140111.1.p1  ORF type:complete len:283 (-),score=55.50 GHVU01140111.1:832-1635(-)